jgi:pimeloyl-ACP methyl ester carboxylesterase
MQASYFARPDGVRLAYRHREGAGPTIVFLPGYASDMQGEKALALDGWAETNGRALLRLDYSGNGESEGAFPDGTLERWRDDALLLIDRLTSGPLIVIGSSMGGWIALLAALARGDRVIGLIGVAAAPDFTDWDFDEAARATLVAEGRIGEPSLYSDEPLYFHRGFWESGQRNLLLAQEIALDCPVRLLHGQEDGDVPWTTSLRTAEALRSADVQTILVKDGDHRLSRPHDLALLTATVAALPVWEMP